MTQRVSDLTTEELQELVESTVRRTLDDYLESLEALGSEKYVASIRDARTDYQSGKLTKLSDLKDE